MKHTTALLAALILNLFPMAANTVDNNYRSPSLNREWAAYDKAARADKPQDKLDALEAIKTKAAASRLAWDHYLACSEYAEVKGRMNWKDYAEALVKKTEEVEILGVPVAVYFVRRDKSELDKLAAYVEDNRTELQKSNFRGFYDGMAYSTFTPVIGELVGNDYEFCLWDLYFRGGEPDSLQKYYKEKYPYAAILEYCEIKDKNDLDALDAFCRKYEGKSISAISRLDLLNLRFRDLRVRSANSDAFRALRADAAELEKFIKSFSGKTDNAIASCCEDDLRFLISQLDDKTASADIKDGILTVTSRNLKTVKVWITNDGKEVYRENFSPETDNYYVMDHMSKALPRLPDGDYVLKCSPNGGDSRYAKYTISVASKADAGGFAVYAADYWTGEPFETVDITLYDNSDKVLATVKDFRLDGFTRLPEIISSQLSEKNRYNCIQLSSGDRLSPKHRPGTPLQLNGEENPAVKNCLILTDRGAYLPGETAHFKAVLFTGTYSYDLAGKGRKVTVRLYDTRANELSSRILTTNEFGSVAGDFFLPKTERGGNYAISVEEDGNHLATKYIHVDEFVLPTFDLTWDTTPRKYVPGDTLRFRGVLKSYSGHSLAGAEVSYQINGNGFKTLKPAPDGSFCIEEISSTEQDFQLYAVKLKVVDGTGETAEFSNSIYVHPYLSVGISLENRASGTFYSTGLGNTSILGEDVARLRITYDVHPKMKVSYEVLRGKEVLGKGPISGNVLEYSFKGMPSGLYTVNVKACLEREDGKVLTEESRMDLMKVSDSDKSLPDGIDILYKKASDGLAVQIGSSNGPAWVVAELYGPDCVLLEKKLVHVPGDKDGQLQIVSFEKKDCYPESLSINLYSFKNGRANSWSASYVLPSKRYVLPLKFTRFTDTLAPGRVCCLEVESVPGVECAATVYDIASSSVQSNDWYALSPSARPVMKVRYSGSNGSDRASVYNMDGPYLAGVTRSMAKMAMKEEKNVMFDSVDSAMALAEESVEESAEIRVGGLGENSGDVHVREDFASTIAWEPFLRTDAKGLANFEFTGGDILSTYRVQVFAHDKKMNNSVLSRDMLVTIPVKVSLVQPQYLYGNDNYSVRVTLSNNMDEAVDGVLSLTASGGPGPVGLECSVPAHGSISRTLPVGSIPAEGVSNLVLLVRFDPDASAGEGAAGDAVRVTIPIKPAFQTIEEAHSALFKFGEDREALVKELRSRFVNVPGSEAIVTEISIRRMLEEAVPGLVEPRSDNAIALSEAIYASALSRRLDPSVPAFGSDVVDKLLACVNSDGGFGWFEGMYSSPIVTAVVLNRCALCHELTDALGDAVVENAVRYLDKVYFSDDDWPFWRGGVSFEQYVAVRSFFPGVEFSSKGVKPELMKAFRKEAKAYLVPSNRRGLDGLILRKARRIRTIRNLASSPEGLALAKAWGVGLNTGRKLEKSQRADIESLMQYAVEHKSGGWYYPNAVMPWRGLLESELFAHSFLCDLLDEVGVETGGRSSAIADGIRLWIMVQKETQKWGEDPAYVEALGSVMRGSEALLETKVIVLKAATQLPFADVKAAGNGFALDCRWLVERDGSFKPVADGDLIRVGDKLRAEYRIWNEENRSFVKLTAPRPAALRPAKQLSGRYGWAGFRYQGYRGVDADASYYWFDTYPEENTVVTEDFFATQEGVFQAPAAQIESLYAPHYRANDEAMAPLVVK